MFIISHFTESGVAKTGLTPLITIWDSDATLIINAVAMSEIAGGFYKYDFTAYDATKNYCFQADGTASLTGAERYKYSTNETDVSSLQEILDALAMYEVSGIVRNSDGHITYLEKELSNAGKTYKLTVTYTGENETGAISELKI
jgi:hypothetical protein